MTNEEREHVRHIASVARSARRTIRLGGPSMCASLSEALDQIENSARHAMASSLPNMREE